MPSTTGPSPDHLRPSRRPAAQPPTALDAYVARPNPSFAWKLEKTIAGPGYRVAVLALTSQTWLSDKAVDDFLDRFLTHAVEANDLLCGGGGQGVAWDFVVSLAGRGSPSEAQRQRLANWLGGQPEVLSYTLGEFVDGWHGREEVPFSASPVQVRA